MAKQLRSFQLIRPATTYQMQPSQYPAAVKGAYDALQKMTMQERMAAHMKFLGEAQEVIDKLWESGSCSKSQALEGLGQMSPFNKV